VADEPVWMPDAIAREARALVESVKDYAIFLLDREGRVMSWNPGAQAIKQYHPDEIIGQHFSRFYTPEEAAAGRPMMLLARAAREGRVEDEGWRVRKDGSRFWAHVVITPVHTPDRRHVGFAKVTHDLTARKAMEDALGRSEQSLSATLYSIGDGVIAADEGGLVTRLNPVAERLTGWLQSEALGQPIETVFHIVNEETGAPAVNPVTRVLAEGIVVGLANHTALIARDGTERPIADSGAPIRDASGAITGAVLVFRDVSEERRAEAALRQSEEKLRLMIASVSDYAIFLLDPEGRVASWNPGANRIKGYRADEIIGAHFSRFYPAEDIKARKPAHELEAAGAHGRFEDEGWRVRKDGSRFWANVVISAVRDESGTLLGFTKVTRDMTERKLAQEELARRALQQAVLAELGIHAVRTRGLQPVLDKAVAQVIETLGTDTAGVFELQPDGQTLLLRAGLGWQEGLVGHATVPASRDSQAGRALLWAGPVLVEEPVAETHAGNLPPGPEHGVVSGMSVVIPVAGEARPYGVLSTYAAKRAAFSREDVSFFQAVANVIATAIGRARADAQIHLAEQAAAEERERTVRAQEAIRERDVFLSVAAHELRTPLTALLLKLQGLEQLVRADLAGTPRAARAQRRFQDALRHTDRLCDLVERLLDVSRIAAGQLEMQLEPVDLEALVRGVVSELQDRASEPKTEIRVTATGAAQGAWDPRRLEQVIRNLLSNAVKYGEGKPIDVAIEDLGAEVRLAVEDRGIGIAAGDLGRIFDAFERAVPLEHYAGLGLGLYITRRIVEAHGGRITVSSAPGEGARFEIRLPRAAPKSSESRAGRQKAPGPHAQGGP
jgi:PAS domain S-box-containing protein